MRTSLDCARQACGGIESLSPDADGSAWLRTQSRLRETTDQIIAKPATSFDDVVARAMLARAWLDKDSDGALFMNEESEFVVVDLIKAVLSLADR